MNPTTNKYNQKKKEINDRLAKVLALLDYKEFCLDNHMTKEMIEADNDPIFKINEVKA